MNEPIDPREMRRRIDRYSRGMETLDGNPGRQTFPQRGVHMSSAVLNAARYLGYSGEDTMTVLAYNALVQLAEVEKQLSELWSLTPINRTFSDRELKDRVFEAVKEGRPIDLSPAWSSGTSAHVPTEPGLSGEGQVAQ